MGWGGVGMLTFVCSWTRHACYAEHVLGWRCERSVEVEDASAATLIMGWGGAGWGGDVNVRLQLNTPRMLRSACVGVEMWTFGWSRRRLCCYADHGVGWGGDVNVPFAVEHATHATLSMCWGGDVNVRLKSNTPLLLRWSWGGVGWGGDVNVRLQLNTPRMLRWACVGVEMWTFGWSRRRLCCYADHGVGWGGVGWGGDVNVRLQLNTPRMLRWACVGVEMWTFGWSRRRLCCYADHGVGWGGVGMLTFVCSWTRHACYAEHVLGWRCERSVEVEDASAATLIMGWDGVGWGGDVNVRLQRSTCTMINESGKAKKVRNLCCKGCKITEKWPFLGTFFPDQKATKHWKGCHFFQHVDAPTRAIPHPAGCFCWKRYAADIEPHVRSSAP